QPIQDEFHACTARDRLMIGGNRSGKSVGGFVEDARAATNADPYKKYPKEGTVVILGFGWEHCGKVVWPMLFRSGAFKVIKDLETGKWRAFRPATDWERRKEAKP